MHRDVDESGVSGTGKVAQGCEFEDGVVCLRWLTEWRSSVTWYEYGIEAVEAIHGHKGKTRIVWLDDNKVEEITHLCPPDFTGIMPCCHRTPFEVPRTDRLALDPSLVTCGGVR